MSDTCRGACGTVSAHGWELNEDETAWVYTKPEPEPEPEPEEEEEEEEEEDDPNRCKGVAHRQLNAS